MNKVNEYKFEQPVNPSLDQPQLIQAMSSETGNFVAIKYISPAITQKLKIEQIYRTFAMFNSLRHKYLIHYHECLHIEGSVYLVMDWCEGKSLLDTLKGYKALPEKLVARYTYELLQGLEYLHSQGNTHDNLKASNILTTNGTTKVTDFGLSATIRNLDVLDHPYWSAPEVLESKTFTKESDIWSLGCTIIELMTGKPPWADLPPEEARNHILTETPPLPANASTHLSDFLRICFKRDPSERPTAKELQTYFWITTNNAVSQEQTIVTPTPTGDSGQIKISVNANEKGKSKTMEEKLAEIERILNDESGNGLGDSDDNDGDAPLKPAPFKPILQIPATSEMLKKKDDELQSKDSESESDAFGGSSSDAFSSSKSDQKKILKPMKPAPLVQLKPTQAQPILELKPKPKASGKNKLEPKLSDSTENSKHMSSSQNSSKHAKGPPKPPQPGLSPKPTPLIALHKPPPPPKGQKSPQSPQLALKTASKKQKNGPKPLILLPGGNNNDTDSGSLSMDDGSSDSDMDLKDLSPPKLAPKPAAPPALLKLGNPNQKAGNNNDKKAIDFGDDDDDDDFKDDSSSAGIGGGGGLSIKPLIKPPPSAPLLQIANANTGGNKMANIDELDLSDTTTSESFQKKPTATPANLGRSDENGILAYVEDDDEDDDMNIDSSEHENGGLVIQQEVRGQANLNFLDESDESEKRIFAHRSKVEELSRELISKLHALNVIKNAAQFHDNLKRISEILKEEPAVRSTLVSQQGVMPIVEIIEFSHIKDNKSSNRILSIIYDMCFEQSQIKENFCLLGGIPPLMKYLESEENAANRQFAVKILTEICSKSQDNTQMFIACNGVSAISKILQYDLDSEWELIVTAIQTVSEIFASQRATQKADLCRLFMKAGVFRPMGEILLHYSTTDSFKTNDKVVKILSTICDLFNTFSQADTKVKLSMSSPEVMGNLINCMYTSKDGVRRVLTLDDTLLLCKTIKFTAMDSETRENLTDAGVMEMTCEMLKTDFGKGESKDKNVLNLLIHSNLIMLLNDMCKLSQVSKKRIGIVADSRLLPHLVEFLKTESELKTMTLSVIMELYNVAKSDKKAMKKLITDNLIGLYLDNLQHPYWGSKAITAISTLLQDEGLEIEPLLVEDSAIQKFRQGIKIVDQENAPTVIKGFTSMARKSENFVNTLVNKEFCQILINKFKMKTDSKTISQVPAALLEFVLAMFQSKAKNVKLYLRSQEMNTIIKQFQTANNVRQKTFAEQILRFFTD